MGARCHTNELTMSSFCFKCNQMILNNEYHIYVCFSNEYNSHILCFDCDTALWATYMIASTSRFVAI